jgi:hypothetical protein
MIDNNNEIKERLSQLFVDEHEFFKNIIDDINNIFEGSDIDFKYDYNTFCKDYIKEILKGDYDLKNGFTYGVIVMKMISEKIIKNHEK